VKEHFVFKYFMCDMTLSKLGPAGEWGGEVRGLNPRANYTASCGLVVRVLGYRSRGSGSIPGATRISEK
jgi:hypothetical protein